MAVDQGTETITVTSQERTVRVNIETLKGVDPIVTVFRERIRTAPDGSILSKDPVGVVQRSLSAVASQTYRVGGSNYTTAEIAAVIAAIADAWREEDIAAAAKQGG